MNKLISKQGLQTLFVVLFAVTVGNGCAKKATQKEYVFWPAHTEEPRIQYVSNITNVEQLAPKSEMEKFLAGPEIVTKKLEYPIDIASMPGKLYVSDRRYKRIIIIDLEAKDFQVLNDRKKPVSTLANPGGLFIDSDQNIYVTDLDRNAVIAFNKDHDFVKLYGSAETLKKPVDVAVYKDKVYVCDIDQHQIIVFDKNSGEKTGTVGEPGSVDSESGLYKPSHVTVDDQGNIYVTGAFNFSIRKFSPTGEIIRAFGSAGDSIWQFARPKGIAVDKEENLYAVDAAYGHVKIFNKEGQLLLVFAGQGWNVPGLMVLPSSVEVDYTNIKYFSQYIHPDFEPKYLIYAVSNQGRDRLTVYVHGTWKGGDHPTPAPENKQEPASN